MLSVAMGKYDPPREGEYFIIDIKNYLVAYPDFLVTTAAVFFVILGRGS